MTKETKNNLINSVGLQQKFFINLNKKMYGEFIVVTNDKTLHCNCIKIDIKSNGMSPIFHLHYKDNKNGKTYVKNVTYTMIKSVSVIKLDKMY